MKTTSIFYRLTLVVAAWILKAEKEIFFCSGYVGLFLRGYWEHTGRTIQKELNDQNGTTYTYGHIID